MQGQSALICHLVYRLDYGGLENGLVNLVNHLPRDRFRHAILCLAGAGAMRARIEHDDVRVLSIDKRPGKDPASYARTWRVLRALRPDIVHTRNLGTIDLQWVAWAAGVRRRVHGEHGWDVTDPRGDAPRTRSIRRACAPVIQRYVAMSRDIARWLRDDIGVAPARIRQIYNGVDTRRYRPGHAMPRDWPWARDDRAGLWVCGTVGRLDPLKNQGALVDAFAELVAQRPA
jgi:sugar transferase (PEP-CTERM/EpsH1 system associated)